MSSVTDVDIFTDGSAEKKKGGRLGCGAFCSYLNEEHRLSLECTRDVLSTYGIPVTQSCSNPTSEFIACIEVLNILKNTPEHYHLKFWIDYNGIMFWTNGTWRAKEPHIKLLLAAYKRIIKTMKCQVSVQWIKGHKDSYGNKQADLQAGLYTTDISGFKELANSLMQ